MATLDWPLGRPFGARHFAFGVRPSKSAFSGFFTRNVQSVSHLADRMLATVLLPKCEPLEGARREAFFMEVAEAGHWVRLSHLQRPEPGGTMRGTPSVLSASAAGVRSIVLQTTAGATLQAGDPIGIAQQLLLVGYAGAVADGLGQMVVPLVLPTRKPITAGAGVAWAAPTGVFQMLTDTAMFGYGRNAWQDELELRFMEV